MERTWGKQTDELIARALDEDIGAGDITTKAIVPPKATGTAFLFSKDAGVLAGIDVARKVFSQIDPKLSFKGFFADGDPIANGHKILEISGSIASILKGERTALNFLGRMTGIASRTALFVRKVDGLHTKIIDTRKTMPTMRHLDKYAVRVGGGSNHRFGLYDMVLIKDNHIAIAGGIRIAVEQVVNSIKNRDKIKIEVECKSYDDVLEAIYTPLDIIMLDNMEIPEIELSVKSIREASEKNGRTIRVEASGNMVIDTVRAVAETGVDYVSVGGLTHSVINHDFTLLFEEL